MKKIVKLTETDLTRLVKKVIKEEYWKDYNEELEELESNLDMIQERLEGLTQIIDNDDNLDDDEKDNLQDYVDELYIRCKPKKRR
jgi:SMC interacting uncharacterized protein involved in chromosome segregation